METPTTEQPTEQPKNWSLLASEAFGTGYKGEVHPDPVNAPTESVEAAETTEETTEAPAVEAAEAETDQSPEVEEAPISSIDELIAHYELDPEWMDTLEIPVKINGETGKAKLADLKKSYQITEAAESRLKEAKERAKAETQVIAEKREQLNSQFAVVAGLIDKAEKSLTKDEAAINWDSLRVNDPSEWAAKREEFKSRKEEINALKQEAVGSYKSTIAQSQQESAEQQKQFLQEQAQLLVEKLPEWKDPDTAKAEKTAVAEYLLNQGFNQEDISSASDHRMIILARKAMLFDKGQNKAAITQKKVTKIPKVLRPGAPKSTEQINKEQVSQVKSRLKQSGSLEDALALMRTRRGN